MSSAPLPQSAHASISLSRSLLHTSLYILPSLPVLLRSPLFLPPSISLPSTSITSPLRFLFLSLTLPSASLSSLFPSPYTSLSLPLHSLSPLSHLLALFASFCITVCRPIALSPYMSLSLPPNTSLSLHVSLSPSLYLSRPTCLSLSISIPLSPYMSLSPWVPADWRKRQC